jgi:hypothetical protein
MVHTSWITSLKNVKNPKRLGDLPKIMKCILERGKKYECFGTVKK